MKRLLLIALALAFVLGACAPVTGPAKVEDCMSVRFTAPGTAQYIDWGNSPQDAIGLQSKTVAFELKMHTVAVSKLLFNIIDSGAAAGEESFQIRTSDSATRKLLIISGWSTNAGVWTTTNDVLTAGTKHSIIVSYNAGSTANNPVVYVDGVSKAVTRVAAPSGTWASGKAQPEIYLGSKGTAAPDAEIEDVRVYSAIKTAAQAALIAAEDIKTSATIDESSLVFHAPLVMCKGSSYPTFPGTTLGAGNQFFDRKGGYLGTPSGSPIGR